MAPNVLSKALLILAGGLWIFAVSPSDAASFALTEREREEALRAGRRSVISEEFGAEWKVPGAAGQRLEVMTPFHRLALASRNATFQQEALKPKDIEALLKEHTGKLVIWATLRGRTVDFARFYLPVLRDGAAEIKAAFVQNERTALPEDGGWYAARCQFVFPAERLNPNGRVTLVVQDAGEKEVATFVVDLSTMR